jgi:hypothetical protein
VSPAVHGAVVLGLARGDGQRVLLHRRELRRARTGRGGGDAAPAASRVSRGEFGLSPQWTGRRPRWIGSRTLHQLSPCSALNRTRTRRVRKIAVRVRGCGEGRRTKNSENTQSADAEATGCERGKRLGETGTREEAAADWERRGRRTTGLLGRGSFFSLSF